MMRTKRWAMLNLVAEVPVSLRRMLLSVMKYELMIFKGKYTWKLLCLLHPHRLRLCAS
jgi:hypothetical protein